MTRQRLADQLRRRYLDRSCGLGRETIYGLTDDEVIDMAATCSCGEKHVSDRELREAVLIANNAEQFLMACGVEDEALVG